jgi:hypothetical protein
LSAQPTLTALSTSTASALPGQSVTFTATVSNLSAGGATPDAGTVTFRDQNGVLDSETLVAGVARFTTPSLPLGTHTVTASYSGTGAFAPSSTGTIVTAAGNGTAGYAGNNGPATAAKLNAPWGLAVDSAGDLFIADGNNNRIREVVKATGDIITVAGDGKAGYSGDNGPATAAELHNPNTVAVDSAGDLFISDENNNRIRELVQATGEIMTIAGNGIAGYSGDNGPATAAEIDSPRGLSVDSAGDVFFADNPNNRVREVVKATGDIITVAGNGQAGYTGNNGPATAAKLNAPNFVAVDPAGNLFIGDANNNAVREVVKSTGTIIAVAGNGTAGYSGDNGPATAAELNNPLGVAFDSAGNLFIADNGEERVREVVKATGDIITVAGNGIAGYSGDNGPATAAELHGTGRVAVDSAGDVFVVNKDNNVVREFAPAMTVIISATTTRTPTITWSNPASIVYGTALGDSQLDATASVAGTFSFSPAAGTVLKAGNGQKLTVTFTPVDTADYTTTTHTVTIDVLPATPTITWSNPADILSGTALGAAQLNATASATVGGVSVNVPGTFTYTPGAGTVLNAGNGQTLTVSFTPADTTDYTTASATVTLNVLSRGSGGPSGPHATRTVLTAKPRPANLGKPVTLTATVKNLTRAGGTPGGSITFQDGTTSLGTVALRHGRAILKTSSLLLGPNTIQADYTPSQGFAPSTASLIEIVRARRSRHKAVTSAELASRAVPSRPRVIRPHTTTAIPPGAAMIVGGPARV